MNLTVSVRYIPNADYDGPEVPPTTVDLGSVLTSDVLVLTLETEIGAIAICVNCDQPISLDDNEAGGSVWRHVTSGSTVCRTDPARPERYAEPPSRFGEHEFTIGDIVGRVDTCFRCDEQIASQLEIAWIGGDSRSDCPESEDGAPHEPDPDDD